MNDAQTLTTFLGWCTAINMALLCVTSLLILAFRDWLVGIHSRMLGIDRSELPAMYFKFLSNYKVLIIVFNFVPWIALELMG